MLLLETNKPNSTIVTLVREILFDVKVGGAQCSLEHTVSTFESSSR